MSAPDAAPVATPSPTGLVSLHDVGKTFANGLTALARFNLQAERGEFVSLLGPSGCGKSTALRIIAGLTEPTVGTIRWTIDDPRGRLGFVFQEPTLMPWASVADNVWLPLRLRGVSRPDAEESIRESLALVDMAEFASALPHALSGGMRMRVSIARALTLKPSLLLLDEPFAALDELTRFRLNDDLQRLRHRLGCTVVFVTHSVFESVYLSDKIAIMSPRPGRVVDELPIDEPFPRDMDFRTTTRYARLCRKVSGLLADHSAPGTAT